MRSFGFVLLLGLAACGASDSGSPSDPALPDGSVSPRSPTILSLKTNVLTVKDTDRLVVSAVVTDPDGIDDLIGGELTTADGTATYGAFATDAGEVAYSIVLSWGDLNTAETIETLAGETVPRTLKATFFDVAGHAAHRDVTVDIGCAGNNASCGGTCAPTDELTSCGTCGHSCPQSLIVPATCDTSSSEPQCSIFLTSNQRGACTSSCWGSYSKCYRATARYTDGAAVALGCGVVASQTHGAGQFISIDCYCTEP